MKKLRRFIASLLPLLLLLTFLTGNANAALQAVGPVDPTTGFPLWYQDAGGLALSQCLDLPATTGGIPYCTLLADATFNPALPIVKLPTLSNYPMENFYWVADNKFNTVPGVAGAIASMRIALESTFATTTPQNGNQITFLLVNLQKMSGLPPNTTFTVTHPFGSFQVTSNATGNTAPLTSGQAFRVRDDFTPIPGVFNTLLLAPLTHIGPFLRPSATPGGAALPPILDVVSGNTYLTNPLIPTAITGGTNGNIVTITGTGIGGPGVNSVSSSLWNLQGKVFLGAIGSPLATDRATYARDAVTGQVDVFVTGLAADATSLVISGTGIASTTMTQDLLNPTKYFAHISTPTPNLLPASINITNNFDVPPFVHVVPLVDEVNISQAIYNPVTQNLTIKADSRDNQAPLPALTAVGFAAPNTFDATGTLVKSLTGTIPPLTVSVSSSKGGSATLPVSVVTPPAPPLAVADTATTTAGTAVVIPVLVNDTTTGTLDPTSVVTTTPVGGIAVANANGTVTFTPTAGFTGAASFTYTVKDTFAQISNSVTVAVTVTAAISAPVANNDTATVPAGSPIIINVIGNDTATAPSIINPASLTVTTPTGGTAAAHLDGTITYTAPTVAGTYTFTYTVKDNFATPATSNIATVTITVLPVSTMTTPVNASTLTGASQTFTWANTGASLYSLWVGRSLGNSDIFATSGGTIATTVNVTGLPTNGSTVFVRLWTLVNNTWVFNDYTYTAASLNLLATMTSPVNASILVGANQTFTWSNSGASLYSLWVGTTLGNSNIFATSGGTAATTVNATGFPSNGSTVFVRLWTLVNGSWLFNDYTYTSN